MKPNGCTHEDTPASVLRAAQEHSSDYPLGFDSWTIACFSSTVGLVQEKN